MLFGWNPNPGTAFYVGYNDDVNYRGYNPFDGNLEPGFARNGRTFFIRVRICFERASSSLLLFAGEAVGSDGPTAIFLLVRPLSR